MPCRSDYFWRSRFRTVCGQSGLCGRRGQCRVSMMSTPSTKSSRLRQRIRSVLSFSECNINQQLLARDIDHVAERPFTLACEVKRDTAVAHAQVANAEKIQPVRERGIHDIQLFPRSRWPNTEH